MTAEHLDVLVIGAGLSGVGAACHLQRDCPELTYAVLESRADLGGTWSLFRYPGIRSDSDMFTLGYSFKPWTDAKAIADGPAILRYIRETAAEYGVDRHIRFRHQVERAAWSTADARWTVTARKADGTSATFTCRWLACCTGYYRYDEGYTPDFPGRARFRGRIVHPQHWPDELDYAGQRVVVIGSGATAVTLVPAMAERAAHVTMLQRSPTYIVSVPARDPIADAVRARLPPKVAYPIVRWKNVLLGTAMFQLARRAPRVMKALIRRGATTFLPKDYDYAHLTPSYQPWDQRLCLVPDGDLFRAIAGGKASIVTDRLDTFTEDGLRLASGRELPADLVVTATGLNLLVAGGMQLEVDGRAIVPSETVGYKGMMLSGVPNFSLTLGYTNASWTLKADLIAGYMCRLLRHMDTHGLRIATPRAPDPSLPREPFIDLQSGYVQRAAAALPKQGPRTPWRLHQNYVRDVRMFRHGPVEDEAIVFSRGAS